MDWTEDQKKAIYEKDNNILVAAAAGSGKTAVLVERIIQKILSDGVDIDRLLVVTFTNAAASEMRERVLEAIYKKLDEDPENDNLQRQIILLGKANICTMHSFCLNVIRNNFFEIDIPATFRIGGEKEIMLLKVEVLEDLFEELYESNDKDFEKLINTYTDYRSDDSLKELVLNIHKYIQSMPFPKEWLIENVEKFARSSDNTDFAQSIWGKVIIESVKPEIKNGIETLKSIRDKLIMSDEIEECAIVIEEDIKVLKGFYDMMDKTWDEIVCYAQNISFASWPSKKRWNVER